MFLSQLALLLCSSKSTSTGRLYNKASRAPSVILVE